MPANSFSRMDSSGSGSESDKANESILGTSPGTSFQISDDATDKRPVFVLPSVDGRKRLITYFRVVADSKNVVPPPPGYVDFVDKLDICIAFKRVILYNFSVFGDFYRTVLKKDAPIPMPTKSPVPTTSSSIEEVD
ncbi:hypothetical protein Bhyg_11742, partial [Pseudolycoriella hygida]